MILQKYWAIRCKTFYMKSLNPIGWPYLTFVTKQAALDYINQHRIDGEPARVTVTLKEAI
jgi:hypothetical protein